MNKSLPTALGGVWRHVAAAVVCALCLSSARAIPPAPYHLVYGLARDQYGTPLTSANSYVILQSQSGAQFSAQIIPGLGAGINYQIKVPMDAGQTSQLYRPDALVVSTPYIMLIAVGTTTNLPIEMAGTTVLLGQFGSSTRINLTLGKDSNRDGIPDQWEIAYLATLNTNIALASLNANSIPAGHLTMMQAYLLGLPVFEPGTSFQVSLVGFVGNSPVVQFPGLTGRSYTVMGSSDLKSWATLPVNLPTDAPGTPSQPFFYSSAIKNVQLQVNLPTTAPSAMFLKVLLQ